MRRALFESERKWWKLKRKGKRGRGRREKETKDSDLITDARKRERTRTEGWKLDEKGSRRTGESRGKAGELESASYSRREKTGVPTIPLNGGTSAALHCAVRCTHPRHPICSTQPRTPREEKSERNDEVDHERKRGRESRCSPCGLVPELYRHIVLPAER